MKTLACKDMGETSCDFVAKGETDKEIMDKMMEHVKKEHPDMASMPKGDMMKMMKDNMKMT